MIWVFISVLTNGSAMFFKSEDEPGGWSSEA